MPRRRLRTRKSSDYPGELRGNANFVRYTPTNGPGIAHRVKTRQHARLLAARGAISAENLAEFLPLLPECPAP